MDGAKIGSVSTVMTDVPDSWHFEQAADFTGDGKADLLLQTDDGIMALLAMDGANVASATVIMTDVSQSWHIEQAADLNADGSADLLLRGDDGTHALWQADQAMFAPQPLESGAAKGWLFG
jgi:hypothetical protein